MIRFRRAKTLQKFASVHTSVHNHFNHDRHPTSRTNFKESRSLALADWQQLAASNDPEHDIRKTRSQRLDSIQGLPVAVIACARHHARGNGNA
jgi:putative transposase